MSLSPESEDRAPRPLIGITGRRWPASHLAPYLVGALHDAEFDLHFTEYPAAVAAAGGIPVELTRDAPVAELLQRLDGVVISGGADVDPSAYGAEPSPGLGHVEPERDAWELAIIAEAVRTGVPVLGICRGAQLLHIHFGGTLTQHVDLDEGVGHPRFDEDRSQRCHAVRFQPGTLAAELYGTATDVNSLHHQVINADGSTTASGHADDGVIEAIEVPGATVFGVQWHPEMLHGSDPGIDWLINHASRRAEQFQQRHSEPAR
jgi:putative glutamine amidotransferase